MQSSDGLIMVCEAAQEPSAKSRILVVDDIGVVRANLREWLEGVFPHAGILEAISGEEAVTLAERHDPHVVVMDVALPGINGFETTRRIKAIRPETRVAMLTIHEELDYRREAESAGADAYVFKRRMASDLIPALTNLISAARDKGGTALLGEGREGKGRG